LQHLLLRTFFWTVTDFVKIAMLSGASKQPESTKRLSIGCRRPSQSSALNEQGVK